MRSNKDIVYTRTNSEIENSKLSFKSLSLQEETRLIDRGNQSKAKMWIFVALHFLATNVLSHLLPKLICKRCNI